MRWGRATHADSQSQKSSNGHTWPHYYTSLIFWAWSSWCLKNTFWNSLLTFQILRTTPPKSVLIFLEDLVTLGLIFQTGNRPSTLVSHRPQDSVSILLCPRHYHGWSQQTFEFAVLALKLQRFSLNSVLFWYYSWAHIHIKKNYTWLELQFSLQMYRGSFFIQQAMAANK